MSKFIKDFNMEVEIFKLKNRYNNKLFMYGLIGEERVAYQLKTCEEDMICLYDVILQIKGKRSQYDFVVVTKKFVYILEVKNLLGNIIVYEDGTVERAIYKKNYIETCGMFNPFVQLSEQKKNMKEFLYINGIEKDIRVVLVMANDKTLIKRNESTYNIVRYDELNNLFSIEINREKLTAEEHELASILLENTKQYNYIISNIIQKKMMSQYTPKFALKSDENYYIELIKLRKEVSKKYNIPACNIYNNKEAEMLVVNKPKTKNEFMNVKGFKEKRYEMFGADVLKIFQNR